MVKKHDKGLKNIGERIKYIRDALTQPEFGKKLGVGRNNVYAWETNKNTPSAETLLLIYKEYGVNINWLLSGEGNPYLKRLKYPPVIETRIIKRPIEAPSEAETSSEQEKSNGGVISDLSQVFVPKSFADTTPGMVIRWYKDAKSTSEKIGITIVLILFILFFVAVYLTGD